MVTESIDNTIKAVEADNKKVALTELKKAQEALVLVKNSIGKLVKSQFANVRCPIMGLPINPDKVAGNLVRSYKGQNIAFCCAGCPAQWEKLTDAEKDAKLAKVKPRQMKKCCKDKQNSAVK